MLWLILQHGKGRSPVPLHDVQPFLQLAIREEQLGYIERIADKLLVHSLAYEVCIHGKSAEGILYKVHIGKGRWYGRAWCIGESGVRVANHVYLVGPILCRQANPTLACSLVVIA